MLCCFFIMLFYVSCLVSRIEHFCWFVNLFFRVSMFWRVLKTCFYRSTLNLFLFSLTFCSTLSKHYEAWRSRNPKQAAKSESPKIPPLKRAKTGDADEFLLRSCALFMARKCTQLQCFPFALFGRPLQRKRWSQRSHSRPEKQPRKMAVRSGSR
jgi:hypothetical protein